MLGFPDSIMFVYQSRIAIIFPMKFTHTFIVACVVLLTGTAARAQDRKPNRSRRRLSRGPGTLSGSASTSGAFRT